MTVSTHQRNRRFLLAGMASLPALFAILALLLLRPGAAAARGEPAASGRPPAATIISGDIAADATWTAAGNPYQVQANTNVLAGVKLSIQPGVEVVFTDNTALTVLGELEAVGSQAQPIHFSGETQTPGAWQGLIFDGAPGAPVTGTLSNVLFEYGGKNCSFCGSVYIEHGLLNIDHGAFRSSGGHGVYAGPGGTVNASATAFENNGGTALFLTDVTVDPALSDLTASGNGADVVALGGAANSILTAGYTWENMGLPYRVATGLFVQAGASLKVDPGVEVQFAPSQRLEVFGQVEMAGTPAKPITLTGVTKTAGSWQGIILDGTPADPVTALFAYTNIEFGGLNCSSCAGLVTEQTLLTFDHSSLRASSGYGVLAGLGSQAQITDSSFAGNANYPIYLADISKHHNLSGLAFSGNGVNAIALGGTGPGLADGAYLWKALGVPYDIVGALSLGPKASLEIEPGVEVRFADDQRFDVFGVLEAIGLPSQPITFTGINKTPGAWQGIAFPGNVQPMATGELSYVTVEYGGWDCSSCANVYVGRARVHISRSNIRDGLGSGIYFGGPDGDLVVETSRITGNAKYGVYNATFDRRTLAAANNWWGDPSGPATPDNACNPGGAGSAVNRQVAFRPVLSGPNEDPGPVAPGDARLVSLTPSRWFAPANGASRINVTITIRDGNGVPLPGRKVLLRSSLGNAVSGGITDVNGKSFAYVTSSQAGDAQLSAELQLEGACEFARSDVSTVTFRSLDETGSLTEAQSPYVNNSIEIEPRPIVVGTPSKLRARLTNPNNFPISVSASFAYAQLGLGLTFGPIGEVQNQVIPANSEGVLEIPWTPLVSGHFCVRVQYEWEAVGAGNQPAAGLNRWEDQHNANAAPGPFMPPRNKSALDKANRADTSLGDITFAAASLDNLRDAPSGFLQGLMVSNILDFIFENGSAIDCAMGGGASCSGWKGPKMHYPGESMGNLGQDPPSLDYQTVVPLEHIDFPHAQPSATLPAARAQAVNDLVEAGLDLSAKLVAAVASYDRYAGATEAGEIGWASQQASAYLFYLQQAGLAYSDVADKIDALIAEVQAEGYVDIVLSADDYRAYQQRLQTQGFNAQELQAARIAGRTDEGIDASLAHRLAVDPDQAAGSVLAKLQEVSAAYREASWALTYVPAYGGSTGSAGAPIAAIEHDLARLYPAVQTIQVGNPLTQTATITLKERRIDLPPDWAVTVTPWEVTLDPGEQVSVTVKVRPGVPVAQETMPRVAIEGYAGSQLIGGVALDVLVPKELPFSLPTTLYLPVLRMP